MTEKVKPYSNVTGRCPKCEGKSYVDRFLTGVTPIRDEEGRYSILLYGGDEHLVVRCHVCGFEWLMKPRDSVDK